MISIFLNEKFKEIYLHESLKLRYAISNFGRLVSFKDEIKNGRIVKGSLIEGYRIFRYKIRVNGETKHRHVFFYRLVAENFIEKTSEEQVYVLHLDRDRANDQGYNLQWATRQEMLQHQNTSPYVIEARKNLSLGKTKNSGAKLTQTKAMVLKKRLLDPKRKTRMKILALEFGVSEMQLYRIKRGENWGNLEV